MISVNDLLLSLGVFLGVCLATTVSVLLTIALVNAIKTLRRLSKLIDDNAAAVGKTMGKLPGLADSLDGAAKGVKTNAERIGTAAVALEGTFAGEAEGSDTVTAIAGIAEGILKLITGYLANRNKE
jgi:hypothetical protein